MPLTLLLADDSSTIQRVVTLTFAQEDVRVISVADGEQALQSVEQEQPDIILADAGMPKIDGYALSSRLKASPGLKHIPVLLLAGAFEPVDQKRLKDAQCDGVLVKPFEPRVLITRVQELLDSARAQRVADSTPRLATTVPDGLAGLVTPDPAPTVPSWYRERSGAATRPDAPVLDGSDLDRRLGQMTRDAYAPTAAQRVAPAAPPKAVPTPVPTSAGPDRGAKVPTPPAERPTVARPAAPAATAPAAPAPSGQVSRPGVSVDPAALDQPVERKPKPAARVDATGPPPVTLVKEEMPVAPALVAEPASVPLVRPESRSAPPPPAAAVVPPAPVARPVAARVAAAPTPPPAPAEPAAPVLPELRISLATAFAVILEAEQPASTSGSSGAKSETTVEEALRRALFGKTVSDRTMNDPMSRPVPRQAAPKGGPAPQ